MLCGVRSEREFGIRFSQISLAGPTAGWRQSVQFFVERVNLFLQFQKRFQDFLTFKTFGLRWGWRRGRSRRAVRTCNGNRAGSRADSSTPAAAIVIVEDIPIITNDFDQYQRRCFQIDYISIPVSDLPYDLITSLLSIHDALASLVDGTCGILNFFCLSHVISVVFFPLRRGTLEWIIR